MIDQCILNNNLSNESNKLNTKIERTENQFAIFRNESESTKQLIE